MEVADRGSETIPTRRCAPPRLVSLTEGGVLPSPPVKEGRDAMEIADGVV
jgi:hypothetical protein